MEFDVKKFRNRVKEAFRGDSQAETGEKIEIAQSNVSKLLSNSSTQLPRADTLFRIAEAYNVSVDWLLGISEKKQIPRNDNVVSYASAVRTLLDLCRHQMPAVTAVNYESGIGISFKFDDPLLKFLVQKSLLLYSADAELYQDWIETKLAEFEDKPLIFSDIWYDKNLDFFVNESSEERKWLFIHGEAIELEKEDAEKMAIDESYFFER